MEAEECYHLYRFHLRHDEVLSCKMAYRLATLSITVVPHQDTDWCAMWFVEPGRLFGEYKNYGDGQRATITKIAQKFFKQVTSI